MSALIKLCALLVIAQPLFGDALHDWSVRLPVDENPHNLKGITYGAGLFVAVGEAGIVQSRDGLAWSPSVLPSLKNSPEAIIFANEKFVAVGASGLILSSPDGVTWAVQLSGTVADLHGLAFGSGQFVAFGTHWDDGALQPISVLLTSPDASVWTEHSLAAGAGQIYKLTYGNGVFVAIDGGFSTFTSSDGISWSQWTNDFSPAGLFFANGLFFAPETGQMHTSRDGIKWLSDPLNLQDPVRSPDLQPYILSLTSGWPLVAVGANGALLLSDDAHQWHEGDSGTYQHLRGVAFGSTAYVAVGDLGTILRSSDGTNWLRVAGHPVTRVSDVTYGTHGFVAIAVDNEAWSNTADVILQSDDGGDWRRIDLKSQGHFASRFVYGNDQYRIISRGSGPDSELVTTMWTSADGVIWSTQELGIQSYFGDACYGADRFIFLGWQCGQDCSTGFPIAITSGIGRSWLTQTLPAPVTQISFGNGLFVAVGGTTNLISTNAFDWQSNSMPAGVSAVTSIAFGDGRFVAVSPHDSMIASSINGEVWETFQTGTPSTEYGLVRFGGGVFVYATDLEIMTSLDGLHWDHRPLPTIDNVSLTPEALAFGANRFLLLHGSGILQSGDILPRLTTPQAMPDSFSFAFSGGVTGESLTIEESPDLVSWTKTPLQLAPVTQVPRSPETPRRFYRVQRSQ
jgi:hypothetical protein